MSAGTIAHPAAKAIHYTAHIRPRRNDNDNLGIVQVGHVSDHQLYYNTLYTLLFRSQGWEVFLAYFPPRDRICTRPATCSLTPGPRTD